ncbi:DUF742 domain-containing protein [Actinophytocola gossypii]|uniref:DUF742 domain-containing protein n=1 Tax=Actinophytocola gossypii TaxID=2812003 RepID=UPI0021A72BC2|nr:DUF742 domain-containing protein [Actinophytocola gossypii]
MSAPGGKPESGEVWDATWLEFHNAWRPRLRAFLTSICDRDPDLVDDILRASLLRHRCRWATLDDLDYAHVELFAIVLEQVQAFRGQVSRTPRRSATVVLHDLLELQVGEIAAIQRSTDHVVRMHLALGHRDPDYSGGFTLPAEEAPDVDHGVELLHTAYERLDLPLPAAADDDPETDYALGLVCEQRGDLRGAALCFQRATAHDFEDAVNRFTSVVAQLRLPSRGRHARHALIEPEPPVDPDRLAIEALVLTSEDGHAVADTLPAEQRAICGLCRESRAVAEVAARLNLPLDVARALVGDLAVGGLVIVHETVGADGPPVDLLERVLAGLRTP